MRIVAAAFGGTTFGFPAMLKAVSTMTNSGRSPEKIGRQVFDYLIAEAPAKNMGMAPISLNVALKVLYSGAAGDTQRALGKALGIAENALLGHCGPARPAGGSLTSATALWLHPGTVVALEFAKTIGVCYDASARALPQSGGAKEINAWAATATNGKILHVVDVVDLNTSLILLNAVYFRAGWLTVFEPKANRIGEFRLPSGRKKNLTYMTQVGAFCYRRTETYEWIRLPYFGRNLVMDIVVPTYGIELKTVTGIIFNDDASTLNGLPPTVRGRISLPKFCLTSSNVLNSALSTLGLAEIFSLEKAEFSRMTATRTSLSVSQIKQEVVISVDEAGTEAAAITSVAMIGSLPIRDLEFDLHVDRPFLIAIKDVSETTVLFAGAVNDPA